MPDSTKQGGSNDASDVEITDEDLRSLIANLQNIHKDLRAISTDKIVVSEWVRFKCRYGCPAYGRTLSCPPFSPKPEETRRLLAEYKIAVVVHSKTTPEPGWTHEQHLHQVNVIREKSDASGEKASAAEISDFSALDCRHKDIMRPAMDAFGIDIFQTVRNAGYSIRALKSYSDSADLYAMVLIT